MKLVATIACRNNSSRLYGKPLQRLHTKSVIEFILDRLKEQPEINEIVLAISNEVDNQIYEQIARNYGVKFVYGNDHDVLKRLIDACKLGEGEHVFRITPESPFTYYEGLGIAWKMHLEANADYTAYAKLPDGVMFELIKLKALEISHTQGEDRHRSELCTLYINENKDKFRLNILQVTEALQRPDYRLTIDYPEDLILCRRIVENLGGDQAYIPYGKIIQYLDENPVLRSIVENLEDKNYIKPYH
jgi:spore coat polysaccharide biosynthesis protein SpsF